MKNSINIDSVTAFDLGLSNMTAKAAKDASIQSAAESIATFWASSVMSVAEKRKYLNEIVNGESLKTVVLKMVNLIDTNAYHSVFPVVEYK